MKLDFDIVSRGGALGFEIKNTNTINASGGVGEDVVREIIAKETANLQPKSDEALKTQNKEIVGAINELHEREDKQGLTEEQVKAVVRETAVTQESDPTVPDWAKQAEKPTYSYNEITGKPALFSGDYNDLSNKPTIPSTEGLATVEQVKELEEYSIREVSLGILEDNELSVELKDKEGNIVASAETTLPMPDLTDYVKNTDYATASKAGVVKGNPSGGVRIEAYGGGLAYTEKAPNDEIDLKIQRFKPIVPANLDYAVKVGVTTNTETLTDDEKASACDWLGAMPIVVPPIAYLTYVLTMGKDPSGKSEYILKDFNALADKAYVDEKVGDIESVLTAILGV